MKPWSRTNGNSSPLTAKAEAAFEQASKKVLEQATETKTPTVVWKDGRMVEIPCEQVEMTTPGSQEH
jgi:hypothetical protein